MKLIESYINDANQSCNVNEAKKINDSYLTLWNVAIANAWIVDIGNEFDTQIIKLISDR